MLLRYIVPTFKPSLRLPPVFLSLPIVLSASRRAISTRRRYTAEEDNTIKQLKSAGNSFDEIGLVLGRSRNSCQARYLDYLADQKLPRARKAQCDPQQIFEWVQQGRYLVDIAAELGVSRTTVQRRYKAVCPPHLRTPIEKSRTYGLPYSPHDHDSIVRGLSENRGLTRIARELGRTREAVKKYIQTTSDLRERFLAQTRPFTPAEDDAIKSAKSSGVTNAQLAAQQGRAPSVIYRRALLLHSQLETSSPAKARIRWTNSELQELVKLYDQGMGRADLALHFQRKCVMHALSRALREQGRESKPKRTWSSSMEASLMSMRDDDKTPFRDIALKLGVSKLAAQAKYYLLKNCPAK